MTDQPLVSSLSENAIQLALAAHNRAAMDTYRRMLDVFYLALDTGKSVQAEFSYDEFRGNSCIFKINVSNQ